MSRLANPLRQTGLLVSSTYTSQQATKRACGVVFGRVELNHTGGGLSLLASGLVLLGRLGTQFLCLLLGLVNYGPSIVELHASFERGPAIGSLVVSGTVNSGRGAEALLESFESRKESRHRVGGPTGRSQVLFFDKSVEIRGSRFEN